MRVNGGVFFASLSFYMQVTLILNTRRYISPFKKNFNSVILLFKDKTKIKFYLIIILSIYSLSNLIDIIKIYMILKITY